MATIFEKKLPLSSSMIPYVKHLYHLFTFTKISIFSKLSELKQFKAWVKGFYEEKWFIRDNLNKLNDTELKFGR